MCSQRPRPLLQGIRIEDGGAAIAFWRTYSISLAQSFLLQDAVKVLLVCFISPTWFSKLPCAPGSRAIKLMRICMRGVFNSLLPLL